MLPFDPQQIIHEDNHLLVVNKRPSQIVQGDKTGDTPLSEHLKQYLKEKYNKPGNVFLGVVHRLDRPVSGLVIFARTSKALARMNTLVKNREIRKVYWAVVGKTPPDQQGRLEHFLIKDEKKNKSMVVPAERSGAKKAILDYRLIGTSDRYFLLEVELQTGRHHQIRVQLAKIGCPIKGDVKYGFPRPNKTPFIHLHARELEFVHPVSKENMRFFVEPEGDGLWRKFSPTSGI